VYDEKDETNVGDARGEVAAQEYSNKTDESKRKLPEYACKRRPTECIHNQWAETRYRAVDGISGCHEQKDEIELDISDCFHKLIRFDFLTANACGSLSEPFNSDDAFVGGEKPGFCAGIRDKETPDAEEEG